MTPWQQYLHSLQNPGEPAYPEDEPIVISDDCPATDGMTLEELERLAADRPPFGGNPKARGRMRGTPGRPRVAPDERRCHAVVVSRETGQKARCRKYDLAHGYCFYHQTHAPEVSDERRDGGPEGADGPDGQEGL